MWNKPTKAQLDKVPRLYSTEKIPPKDRLIYLHFFIGGCDWYIAEYDGEDIFYGFAIMNNDTEMAEWSYISFNEMEEVKTLGGHLDLSYPMEADASLILPEEVLPFPREEPDYLDFPPLFEEGERDPGFFGDPNLLIKKRRGPGAPPGLPAPLAPPHASATPRLTSP